MKNTTLNFMIMQTAYVNTKHVHFNSSTHYYKLLNIFYLLQTGVWPIYSITFIQLPHLCYKPQTHRFFTFTNNLLLFP